MQYDLERLKTNETIFYALYDYNDPIFVYIIKSNGLRSRTEQENGYGYIVCREDAHGTQYPVEYLTKKEVEKKYGIRIQNW